jgi:hypothetical protein
LFWDAEVFAFAYGLEKGENVPSQQDVAGGDGRQILDEKS